MNWQNSNFQIAYFLAGKCHTPDEAYRVLKSQLADREQAIAQAHRNKVLALYDKNRNDLDAIDRTTLDCFEQALREADFIRLCLAKIEPFRKYAHLPDFEAHQAAQLDEWELEFIFRAENYIACEGRIPAEQLAAMRLHPRFKTSIAPVLQQLTNDARSGQLPLSDKPQWTQQLEFKE